MKTEHHAYTTTQPTALIADALTRAYTQLRADVSTITDPLGPIPAPGQTPPDIAVVGEGRNLIGGYWAVQAYVQDQGTHRYVELVALGQPLHERALAGARNTVSLTKSTQKLNDIAATLHTATGDLTPTTD